MTSLVKLAAKLPDDNDLNGLDPWSGVLKKRPRDQFVAIVYLDVAKMTTDYDKALIYPTVQVVAIEVVGDVSDVPAAVVDAYNAARDKRQARTPLPFDETPPPPAVPGQLALTDGVDLEASLIQADMMMEEPCNCGHPYGDHDIDEAHCTATDCRCSSFAAYEVVDYEVIDPETGEILDGEDDDDVE